MVRIFVFIILSVFVQSISAQGKTHTFNQYPVEFDFPSDLQIRQDGKRSWTVYSDDTGTEFYINLYKVGLRFNADSLRYLITSLYEGDESVTNIQPGEIASGKMGVHPCERFTLTFRSAEGKAYQTTAYLVHFQIDRKYNSFLFYFEIGEKNVVSYAPIQEAMISSLRYKEFNYKKTTYQKDQVTVEYPDFWTEELKSDSIEYFQIDDGNCKIIISSYTPKDSTSLNYYADMERDLWKKDIPNFPDLKIKSGTEKLKDGDIIAKNSGSFNATIQNVVRKLIFSKTWYRRTVDGKVKDFTLYMEYPENYENYYLPIFKKINEAVVWPGVKIEEKKN